MRYILNSEDYIEEVTFDYNVECKGQTCVVYTGTTPTGYDSLEEWATNETAEGKLNAWKIVEGNLVFDSDKYYKLQLIYEQDAKDNAFVTKKQLGLKTTEQTAAYNDLFPSKNSVAGSITSADGTADLEVEKITLTTSTTISNFIELEFLHKNFLPNYAVDTSNNGITYTIDSSKLINIVGIATAKSTLNLVGTDTSIKNVFTFKANTNYFLYGVVSGISLEFYHYDGTDRTLVGSFVQGDTILFDTDKNITQIVLVVEEGANFESGTTSSPRIFISTEDTSNIEFKHNTVLIDLESNTFTANDTIEIEKNQVILKKNGITNVYLNEVTMPQTYESITNAYSHQNVLVSFVYKDPRNVDITKITLEGLLSLTNIESEYNFTVADAEKVIAYATGTGTLTDEELIEYDVNGDGIVDKTDANIMLRMYYGYISNIVTGLLEINTTNSQRTIILKDSDGKMQTSIGLNGITSPNITCGGYSVLGTEIFTGGRQINSSVGGTTSLVGMPNLSKHVGKKIKFYIQYSSDAAKSFEFIVGESSTNYFVNCVRDYGGLDTWSTLFVFQNTHSKTWSCLTGHSYRINGTTISQINPSSYTFELIKVTITS